MRQGIYKEDIRGKNNRYGDKGSYCISNSMKICPSMNALNNDKHGFILKYYKRGRYESHMEIENRERDKYKKTNY